MDLNIIDISNDLFTAQLYPGDPAPRVEPLSVIGKDGSDCNMALLTTALHCGTHVDAPLHFLSNGIPMIKMPVEAFVGECEVISVKPGPITGEIVERYFPRRAERILIKGGGKAYFEASGAEELAFYGIKLVGTDALSIGTKGAQAAPHKAFLREGVAILEGLNLEEVTPGKYFLIAPPLKMSLVEASPVRALLIQDYIFWGGK